MTWNWELPDWPKFTWDVSSLKSAEETFLRQSGVVLGAQSHLPTGDEASLVVDLMSEEATDTAQIEGELLDRHSIQASIRKHLGLAAHRRSGPAEAGIAEMMIDLYKTSQKPLSETDLLTWHGMVMRGRWDLATVGRYRHHQDAMEIISGPVGRERVHFVAPPAERLADEMQVFFSWLNEGGRALPAVTRAGIAHLWFESLHPFEDGNGRLGRAIIERTLAQGAGRPLITGVSGEILHRRKEYYRQLGAANRTLEITPWLRWFADVTLSAQQRTLAKVSFVIQKGRLLERLGPLMNNRQQKAVLRMFEEGVDGFKGGLSAANYMRITGATVSTTTRDLAGLVAMGALMRTGERKAARYHLDIELARFSSANNYLDR